MTFSDDDWRRMLYGNPGRPTGGPFDLGAALGFTPTSSPPAMAAPPPAPEQPPPAPVAQINPTADDELEKQKARQAQMMSMGAPGMGGPPRPSGGGGSLAGTAASLAGMGIGTALGGPVGGFVGSTLGKVLGGLF